MDTTNITNSLTLSQQIEKEKKEIVTDFFSMSIGELATMYKEGDLILNPNFQRLFRWTNNQKTRFIESVLLELPIPSVFVAQTPTGKWEVVDGLQRLSTIFEFMGILIDPEGKLKPPFILSQAKKLTALENNVWDLDLLDKNDDKNIAFPSEQKRFFRQGRIDVKIIKTSSNPAAKYEIFDRLNSGGSITTLQETRNAALVWLNIDMFNWFQKLIKSENFINTLSLPDTDLYSLRGFDMELALRFFALKNTKIDHKINDVNEFLTAQMETMANNKNFDYATEEIIFNKTFEWLNESLGLEAFKKYNHEKQKFEGKFLLSAFEAITVGLSSNLENWGEITEEKKIELRNKIGKVWTNDKFLKYSKSGIQMAARIKNAVPVGKEMLKYE